jgi:hypothetical protein
VAVALPRSSPKTNAADSTALRAVDYLLVAYLALVSALAVFRVADRSDLLLLLAAHTLFGTFLFLLTRPGLGPAARTIRELYPIFLLPGLYSELDLLNPASIRVHDDLIQQWELSIFGLQVSQWWWQMAPSRFWSAVLHAAYLSYYAIVSAPALFFAWRGNLAAVRRFVLVVMTTFVLCYLFFIFFPVAGPYYTFPRPADWFTDNVPARLVYQALASGSSYGAAFPSSHVAAALVATLSAGRVSRRLGYVLLVPTLLLTVGVVYCQMHYAVDAAAGLVVGGVVSWAVSKGER